MKKNIPLAIVIMLGFVFVGMDCYSCEMDAR